MFHHLEQPGSVHVPYNWVYPDYATMAADTGFMPVDVGKLAFEQDNNTLWMLTVCSPPTWVGVGSVQVSPNYGITMYPDGLGLKIWGADPGTPLAYSAPDGKLKFMFDDNTLELDGAFNLEVAPHRLGYQGQVLTADQLSEPTHGIRQATVLRMLNQPSEGDSVILYPHGGGSPRTYCAVSGGDVQYAIGASVWETMQNLATAVNNDQAVGSFWARATRLLLDSNGVVVFSQTFPPGADYPGVWGTWATQSDCQVVNFGLRAPYYQRPDYSQYRTRNWSFIGFDTLPTDPCANFGMGRDPSYFYDGDIWLVQETKELWVYNKPSQTFEPLRIAHHTTHEAGGSDQLDITGLMPRIVAGVILADPILSLPAHPVTIRVTFDLPFLDNQYAVVAQIVEGDGDYKPLRITDKTAEGFSIVIKGDGATKFCDIDFLAREALVEEFGGYSGQYHDPSAKDFTVGFYPEFTLYADPPTTLIADYTGHDGSAVDYLFDHACYAWDPLDGHIDNYGGVERIPVNTLGLGDRMSETDGPVNVFYSCTNSRGQTIQVSCPVTLVPPPLPDASEVRKTPHYLWAKGFGKTQFNGLYKLTIGSPVPQYQKVGDPGFLLKPRFLNGHYEWWLWNPSSGDCYHGSGVLDWNQEPVGRDYEPNDGGSIVHTQFELSGFGLTPEDIDVNGGPYIFDQFTFDGSGNPTGAIYVNGTNSIVDNFTWMSALNFAVFTTGSGFYNESDDPTTSWHDQWGGGDPEPSAAATQEEP